MRVLCLLLCLVCVAAKTQVYNPCNCMTRVKFESGVIYERVNCCSNWTVREPKQRVVTVAGVVYRLVKNESNVNSSDYYVPFSTDLYTKQVEYPGEAVVLWDPNNQYTNYTCKHCFCHRVRVRREGGCDMGNSLVMAQENCEVLFFDGGFGMDEPLCHNASANATECVIWVPSVMEGGDLVLNLFLGAVSLHTMILFVCVVHAGIWRSNVSMVDIWCMVFLLAFLFALSMATIVAIWRFGKWMALTEVSEPLFQTIPNTTIMFYFRPKYSLT